jgi:hypothetical protein
VLLTVYGLLNFTDVHFNLSDFRVFIAISIILPTLFIAINALQHISNPTQHPLMKTLAQKGNLADVIHNINTELSLPHSQLGHNIHFTKSWLIKTTFLKTDIIHWEDIMWVYPLVQSIKVSGAFGSTDYNYVTIIDRYGKTRSIHIKKTEINFIINDIVQHAPWIFVGYNEETKPINEKKQKQTDMIR